MRTAIGPTRPMPSRRAQEPNITLAGDSLRSRWNGAPPAALLPDLTEPILS